MQILRQFIRFNDQIDIRFFHPFQRQNLRQFARRNVCQTRLYCFAYLFISQSEYLYYILCFFTILLQKRIVNVADWLVAFVQTEVVKLLFDFDKIWLSDLCATAAR